MRQLFFFIIHADILILIFWALALLAFIFKCRRTGLTLGVLGFALLGFLGLSPLGPRLANQLENRFPKVQTMPEGVVGAILLGGSFDRPKSVERGETVFNLTAGRVFAFAQLAHAHPELKFVVTGGGMPVQGGVSEAEMTRDLLKSIGMKTPLILETQSKNTEENATFSAALLKPQKGQKWLLVTSAYHMPRSVGLFRKAGFDVVPYPVDYHTSKEDGSLLATPSFMQGLFLWHYAIREFAGMINAYLAEKSDEIYPAP